jgi:flagellar basal body rod protein FlgB
MPYWDRHWMGKHMEAAAIYATKHSIPKTRKFLTKKMMEEGWDFDGNDFVIEKERDKTVTIRIEYGDEIRIFGHTVKELNFMLEREAEEVEDMF